MIKKRANAVMITDHDVRDLLTEWGRLPAWMKKHMLPAHPMRRYEGELVIDDTSLVFSGRDMKEGVTCEFHIPLDVIVEVYVGFSRELKQDFDNTLEKNTTAPFAVKFRDSYDEKTIYFNAVTDNYIPHININNVNWCETLDKILAKNEREILANNHKQPMVAAF